jgi:hypothetical protein
MRATEAATPDRQQRDELPRLPNLRRSTAVALVIAAVAVVGMIVFVAAAFSQILELVFVPDSWLVSTPAGGGWSST